MSRRPYHVRIVVNVKRRGGTTMSKPRPCHRLDKRVKEFRNVVCSHKKPSEDECYKCLKHLGSMIKMLLQNIIYQKWKIIYKKRRVREREEKRYSKEE